MVAFLAIHSSTDFRGDGNVRSGLVAEETKNSANGGQRRFVAHRMVRFYTLVLAAVCALGGGGGAGRSYSHSLLGQAITGPAFRFFSIRYSLPQLGHFSAMGLLAEVNLQFG